MPESPREALARRLAEYPKEALPFINAGFATAAKLSQETRNRVLIEVVDNFKRGNRRVESATLRNMINLSEREFEQLAAAYTLTIGLLTETQATPEDFVNASVNVLFLPEQEGVARSIAESVGVILSELVDTIERTQLGGAVLPSWERFDAVVDLRIRVVKGEVRAFVPVAIAHIETDVGEELWLQLTKGDVEDTLKKLSNLLEEMKLAEGLTWQKG
jgi:hypothetical protein